MTQQPPFTVATFPLNRGYFALVDPEDYDRLSAYRWYIKTKNDGRIYAQANVEVGGKRTTILMHRFLTGAKDGQKVDHWDSDGLHNWKGNLRVCGQSQNNQNSIRRRNRLTASYKGVWRVKGRGKYRAGIKLDGKKIHLGTFTTEQEAALAYDKAAREMFGDFAKTNFPALGATA